MAEGRLSGSLRSYGDLSRSVGLTTNNCYFTELILALHSKVSVLVFGIIELIFVASNSNIYNNYDNILDTAHLEKFTALKVCSLAR